MLPQTILHRVHKIKGFVYGQVTIRVWAGEPVLAVEIHPRKGSPGICSGCGRKAKTLLQFFGWLGEERSARLEFICSDMWKAYLKVVKKKAGQAIHILDRYHIVAHLNKAVDEVRAQEAKALQKQGNGEVLKLSRWLFLKCPERLKEEQGERLAEIVRHNLARCGPICLRRSFNGSGSIKRQSGRAIFWSGGAPRRCAPGSTR